MTNYNSIKSIVEKLDSVTTRPMFGYQCFSIQKKFFVGFSNKNDYQVITRLPKNQQEKAIKNKGIKPFSHGAKIGWIEMDAKIVTSDEASKWVKMGYENALDLAKKNL